MSSTQEKLEEIQATKVKSNKTRSGYEITLDPEYLTDLIDSAKREARGCIDCQKLRCEDCERLWQT